MYCDCSDGSIDHCLYRSVDGMLKAVAVKDMQNWRSWLFANEVDEVLTSRGPLLNYYIAIDKCAEI